MLTGERTVRRPVGELRLFSSTIDEPRARRATDVLIVIAATVTLVALSVAAEPPPRVVRAVADVISAFPRVLEPLWQILSDLLALASVGLVAAVAVRRRLSVLRDMVIALVLAIVTWQVTARSMGTDWPDVWDALRAATGPSWYPSARLALSAAVFMTASPHVTHPIRRVGRYLTGWGAVALVMLGTTTFLGAFAALLVAAIAAGLVHLAFGSSGGRPGLVYVERGLSELGVPVREIGAASRQEAGLFQVDATDADGRPLIVKVYGRDAYDSALVSTVWRRVWFREAGAPIRLGRLQQVEHEAFMTLFVNQAGVPTDDVVSAGATSADDALLVLRRTGRLLTESERDEPPDQEVLENMWRVVDRLHAAGIAHGRFDASNVLVDADGRPTGVVDLRGAALAPTAAQLAADDVQCLVATLLLAGTSPPGTAPPDPGPPDTGPPDTELSTDDVAVDELDSRQTLALTTAVAAAGAERMEAVLPLVQRSVLTPAQRRAAHEGELDLDQVRSRLAAELGIEPPKLLQLRRITLGSLVRVLLPAVAVIALLSQLAGLDLAEMADVIREAAWGIALVGFVLAQLARVTQAVSTLGAAPVPLPLGPVYALQLAVSYINLAIPSSAARIAVNIRFLQRHGVPPGAALAAGGIDGFSGFIVQALLMASLLLFSTASLDIDLGSAVDSASSILLVVVLIAVAAIGVVAAVGRLRRFVVDWALRLGREALEAVRGLRSPRRLLLLFGGNLGTELLFAAALGAFTRSLGFDIGFAELLLINIGVAFFAGLMPIPGGIGVSEGALTFGLVQTGMPEEQAFAAVMMFRLSSFYLPPIWGAFAFRWLERNGHL